VATTDARSYRSLNLTLLCLIAGAFAFSSLQMRFRDHLPAAWVTCASQRMFGRPCPMCGLTRGVWAVLHGDIDGATRLNPLAVPAAVFLTLELAFRAWGSAASLRERYLRLIIRLDWVSHLAAIAAYAIYAVWFYVRGW
jgi:hypothetical protein